MLKIKNFAGICLLALVLGACNEIQKKIKFPPKKLTLALLPLGNVPAAEVEEVRKTLAYYYDLDIKTLPAAPFPAHTTNAAVGKLLKTTLPLRYRADSLLRYMDKQKRGNFDYILGIANVDITTTNRYKDGQIQFPAWMHADWGIFGLGYVSGGACIVSSFRLRLDNPPLPKVYARLAKVARHEIGHNFGLPHCLNKCFMSAADLRNALVALDHESDSLCLACKRKLGKKVKNRPAKPSTTTFVKENMR